MAERVALVAAAVTTALGADLPATFRALVDGRGALAPVRRFDASAFGDVVAATIEETAADARPDGPTRVSTPHGRLLDALARRAHDDAGFAALARDRLGFFAAIPVVDADPAALAASVAASRAAGGAADLGAFFAGAFRSVHPLWPLEMLGNVALGQAAADLDLRGDNAVFASEADAGARAIAEAADAVRRGELAGAIVVGVGDHVSALALARARLRGVAGETLGEGGGALALEPEGAARARGRVPAAVLGGAGFAFGRSELATGPSSDAIVRAAREALAAASRTTDDVVLLVVEGIGVEEADARRALFGARAPGIAVLAPAVAIGHLRAGAPAVNVALAAAVLATGKAPSTAHGRPRAVGSGVALLLASSSAGSAAALVVERAG